MLLKTSKKTTQKERESNAMQLCMLGEEQKKKQNVITIFI